MSRQDVKFISQTILHRIEEGAGLLKLDEKVLGEQVRRKLAKYARRIENMREAAKERKRLRQPPGRLK
jgi:hypothetical protein